MAKVRGLDVQMHLVGRLGKTRNDPVVKKIETGDRPPRVDIATSENTLQKGAGTTTTAQMHKIPTAFNEPLKPGQGVLGFRMGGSEVRPAARKDGELLFAPGDSLEGLDALKGKEVTVEAYQVARYDSLESAREKGDVFTLTGTINGVEDGALSVEGERGATKLRPRTWQVGRVFGL